MDFLIRHVKLVHSLNDIEKYSGPKVVIASPGDLESGLARELLFSWSANPNNMVVVSVIKVYMYFKFT
jgi:cleavage and polyadenylation specificity factor subunit 2